MGKCRECGLDNPGAFKFCRSCGGLVVAGPPPAAAVGPGGRYSICLELMMQCIGCWQPIAVNALVPRVICTRCSRPSELDVGEWKSLLDLVRRAASSLQPGVMESVTSMGGGQRTLQFGLAAPRCEKCKTGLDLTAALAQARTTNGWAGCTGCGAWIPVRAPAELAAVAPGATCVIGEDPAQLPGMPTTMQVPKASQPVAFPCPKCAGSLPVDGSSRMVACQYCSTSVYLPDDLWQHLHPVATAARWYLLFEVAQPAAGADVTSGQPRLEGRAGSVAGETFLLGGEELSIGRAQDCDICIPESMVNKKHARVVRKDGVSLVVDLKSSNGTRLNGEKLTAPAMLKPGDQIAIGDAVLVYLGS